MVDTTKIYIKNMVCPRCIKVVSEEFGKLGFNIRSIKLGEVELENKLNDKDYENISEVLLENGFELIDDKRSRIIDKIKTSIIELVHYHKDKPEHINISDYLVENIGYDYSYLSRIFSEVESITIEKYFIYQKIERVKELLIYDELTLSEIAWDLGYSSVQHLSNQFKKITGLSPSHFKKLKENRRKPLDKV
ncbi:MAG: AraC family transcriptional regulator [Bacteroidales bacterium]|nr:AraC family transcriptional regulator [Bacteroidales bacterium]